ncbi:hypothetical protein ACSBR1_009227 [Camellia fascicularis]
MKPVEQGANFDPRKKARVTATSSVLKNTNMRLKDTVNQMTTEPGEVDWLLDHNY